VLRPADRQITAGRSAVEERLARQGPIVPQVRPPSQFARQLSLCRQEISHLRDHDVVRDSVGAARHYDHRVDTDPEIRRESAPPCTPVGHSAPSRPRTRRQGRSRSAGAPRCRPPPRGNMFARRDKDHRSNPAPLSGHRFEVPGAPLAEPESAMTEATRRRTARRVGAHRRKSRRSTKAPAPTRWWPTAPGPCR